MNNRRTGYDNPNPEYDWRNDLGWPVPNSSSSSRQASQVSSSKTTHGLDGLPACLEVHQTNGPQDFPRCNLSTPKQPFFGYLPQCAPVQGQGAFSYPSNGIYAPPLCFPGTSIPHPLYPNYNFYPQYGHPLAYEASKQLYQQPYVQQHTPRQLARLPTPNSAFRHSSPPTPNSAFRHSSPPTPNSAFRHSSPQNRANEEYARARYSYNDYKSDTATADNNEQKRTRERQSEIRSIPASTNRNSDSDDEWMWRDVEEIDYSKNTLSNTQQHDPVVVTDDVDSLNVSPSVPEPKQLVIVVPKSIVPLDEVFPDLLAEPSGNSNVHVAKSRKAAVLAPTTKLKRKRDSSDDMENFFMRKNNRVSSRCYAKSSQTNKNRSDGKVLDNCTKEVNERRVMSPDSGISNCVNARCDDGEDVSTGSQQHRNESRSLHHRQQSCIPVTPLSLPASASASNATDLNTLTGEDCFDMNSCDKNEFFGIKIRTDIFDNEDS